MRKLFVSIIAVVLTSSAFATPAIAGKGQSTIFGFNLPDYVERVAILPIDSGNLGAVMPSRSGECPAIARFNFSTVESGAMSSNIAATMHWQKDLTGTGQQICVSMIRADQLAGMPRAGMKLYARVRVGNSDAQVSDAIPVTVACGVTSSACHIVPFEKFSALDQAGSTVQSIQSQVSKIWDATGNKLMQRLSENQGIPAENEKSVQN